MAPVLPPIPAGWVKELLPKMLGAVRLVFPVLKLMFPILRHEIPAPKFHLSSGADKGWISLITPFAELSPPFAEPSPLFAE